MELSIRLSVTLSVGKLVSQLLLVFIVWVALPQDHFLAQARTERTAKTPSLSLCQLTKHKVRYVGRVVRVRLTILGIGGHSTFFIAAEDCRPGTVTILWARFDPRVSGEVKDRFLGVVHLNFDREEPNKTESFLIGRVSYFSNGSRYNLMMTIKGVEKPDRMSPIEAVTRTSCCTWRLDSWF